MTADRPSTRSDFDDDERRFLADFGLPPGEEAPWRACPPLTLLLAAEEGALPPDDQERVGGHLAGCAFCRSLVQDATEAGFGTPTPEERDRILSRVRSEASTLQRQSSSLARRQWFAGPPALAFATLLVLVVAGAWYGRSQQQRAEGLERILTSSRGAEAQEQQRVSVLEGQIAALQTQLERPEGQPNVPVVDLEPVGARRVSETVRSFGVPKDARFVTLILQIDAAGGADDLSAEIRDARGELRWSIEGLRASALGVVTVLVPRAAVPDGESAIALARLRNGRRVTLAEYRARFDPS